MKTWKIKSKVTAIAFVLMLSFAATFVALPIVSAHDPPWEVPTWAYAYVTNDIIGVNQQTVLSFGLTRYRQQQLALMVTGGHGQ